MGLSPKEREGLLNRPANAHERATNDVRVRKKLAAWLKEFDDMVTIFLCLPPEQLRKELDDLHAHRLSFFLTKTMDVLNFHPIVGEIGKPEEWEAIIDARTTKSEMWDRFSICSRPVEDRDITRTLILADVFAELNLFFGNKNPVVEAILLEKLEDDPKLRDRLTEGERRGIKRINEAERADTVAFFGGKLDLTKLKDADDAQWKDDIEAKKDALTRRDTQRDRKGKI